MRSPPRRGSRSGRPPTAPRVSGRTRQAVSLLDQAMRVTTDPAELADTLERSAESASLMSAHDDAVARITRAEEVRAPLGDRPAMARTAAAHGRMLLNGKRVDAARAHLEPATAAFADLDGTPELAMIQGQLARVYFLAEDHRHAIEIADRVLETAEHADLIPLLADTLVTKGTALGTLGRTREAEAVVTAGRLLAEQAGLTPTVLRAINNSTTWLAETSPRASLEAVRGGLALARRLGQASWIFGFAGNLGFSAFRCGEWDLSRTELERALVDAVDPSDRTLLLNNLVNVLAARGEPYEAALAELEGLIAALPEEGWESLLLESSGWIALAGGRPLEAEAAWRASTDLGASAEASGSRSHAAPRSGPATSARQGPTSPASSRRASMVRPSTRRRSPSRRASTRSRAERPRQPTAIARPWRCGEHRTCRGTRRSPRSTWRTCSIRRRRTSRPPPPPRARSWSGSARSRSSSSSTPWSRRSPAPARQRPRPAMRRPPRIRSRRRALAGAGHSARRPARRFRRTSRCPSAARTA